MRNSMDIRLMQARIKCNHDRRGYTNDLPTLGLGLCEEAGEVAKAINLRNPLYVRRKKDKPAEEESLEHELGDLLVYLGAIANAAGIDLSELMHDKLKRQHEEKNDGC
jgi:NTP pyrophosphatase (non-canonical NTP hydrolase)